MEINETAEASAVALRRDGRVKKLSFNDHGNRFQSKLIFFFFMRAINNKFKFYLGTRLVTFGGKFKHVILKKYDESPINSWLYLRAQHKLDEREHCIKAAYLLNSNRSNFSLTKLFHSYRDNVMKETKGGPKPNDEMNCVFLTNIDFDKDDLAKDGIELVPLIPNQLSDFQRKLLTFHPIESSITEDENRNPIDLRPKVPTCYRLKPIRWLDMHYVANVLCDCAKNQGKMLDHREEMFKCYQSALVTEKVIDLETKKFHQDFLDDKDLSEGAKELRNILVRRLQLPLLPNWVFTISNIAKFKNPKNKRSKELIAQKNLDDQETKVKIEEFFTKFIFSVCAPNEEELDRILREEMGKNSKLNEPNDDLQSFYIVNEMVNWFKKKENVWLSDEEGEKILIEKTKQQMDSIHESIISQYYQRDLGRISFNRSAVNEMAVKLESFVTDSNVEKIVVKIITSPMPKFTAVKVIEALQIISIDGKFKFQCYSNYLITSTSRLKMRKESMRNVLLSEGNPYQLLVIVNDIDVPFQLEGSDKAFFSPNEIESLKGKKFIVIGKDNTTNSTLLHADKIAYEQLSDKAKDDLLSKTVIFQGKESAVQELIGACQPDDVLDLKSIEELLLTHDQERKLVIPSYSNSQFQKSFYIKRKMRCCFQYDDTFWNKLAENLNKEEEGPKMTAEELKEQCTINAETGSFVLNGGLKAGVKKKIEQEMLKTTNKKREMPEDDLIHEENSERQVVIIKGVAGTGKSTVLSHFYDEIKNKDPNIWVIRMDLKEHFEDFARYDGK